MKQVKRFVCLTLALIMSLSACQITTFEGRNQSTPVAKVEGKDFLIKDSNGTYKKEFLDGVNMGVAKPGYFPGEFGITEADYYRWFKYIKEMNVQVVRVYVNQSPAFYNAFYKFNKSSKDPLYLMHGVYVNEEYIAETLDAYGKNGLVYNSFSSDIKNMIDMVHGNLVLPVKPGHAGGEYTNDVSQWVIANIIGIEWSADFVIGTNEANPQKTEFSGEYVKTKDASPFEVFLAEMAECTIKYEKEKYGAERPLALANWATTDPISHPNEPLVQEDAVSVDVEHILATSKFKAGFFASYHIYPYYPDFLSFDDDYISGENPNPYLTYVSQINNYHTMPVLISEYGLSTSRGITHKNQVTGMTQGMATEERQAEWLISLNEDIKKSGCMGGFIFTWQDEWFKRTWNTMDYEDSDRRPFWENAQSPEGKFGLLGFESDIGVDVKIDGSFNEWKEEHLVTENDGIKLFAQSDYSYLYLMVDAEDFDFNKDTLYIPLDVISKQGNTKYNSLSFSDGADFLIKISGKENSTVLVDSYYDVFYYDYSERHNFFEPIQGQNEKDSGYFNPIYLAMNKKLFLPETKETTEFERYDTGVLLFGSQNKNSDDYNSLADFYCRGSKTEIRIPWGLIGFADPSSKLVINDFHTTNELGTVKTKGVSMSVCREGTESTTDLKLYTWQDWDMPTTKERLKESYYVLKEYFATQH